jgi:hypothetical protein
MRYVVADLSAWTTEASSCIEGAMNISSEVVVTEAGLAVAFAGEATRRDMV